VTTSHLQRETAEQPEVAAGFLDIHLRRLDRLRSAMRPDTIDGIVLVARGSSDNAARYAQYLWSIRTGIPVALATPSLHTVYRTGVDLRRRAVVAVSQSGTSPDVVEVLRAARDQGAPALAITNDPASPLADAATEVLDLGAGTEQSVAATKTYTTSLLALAMLGAALSGAGTRDDDEAALARLPEAMTAAVRDTVGIDEAAGLVEAAWRGVVVGRGLNMSTAFETALKLTELTGSLVVPFSPADLLHGPVGAVTADVPVVLVAPDEPASASVLEIAPKAAERGAPVVVIGPRSAAETVRGAGVPAVAVELAAGASIADWLTPLVSVIPGQLLARAVAERRGVDVDRPGGLTKVTLTS
jgi:glucosamine--fructose-6-phosphate aminotransferase (isomerizing)